MQNDTLHLEGDLKYWVVTTFLYVNTHLVNTRVLFKRFTFLFGLVLMLQVRMKFRFYLTNVQRKLCPIARG